jgi:hypothetical protein
MTPLHDLFSLVCSQDASRSYTIAGVVLPFCQRCTGLYLGLGIGMVTQWISGSFRRGLPSGAIFYVAVLCLMIMPVFGLHWLDPGPAWRLWSGLIYGNAIAHLLMPAVFTLGSQARQLRGGRRNGVSTFWVQFAFINTLPMWFPLHSVAFAWVVTSLACVGCLGAVACLAACWVLFVKALINHLSVKGDLHGTTQS